MNSLFSKKYWLLLFAGSVCSVSSCLFYSSNGATLQSMIVTAVFVLMTMFMKQENQLYMIALSLPNTKALALGGISASILICVVAVMWNYIKRNKRASIPMTAIILLFYCIQYLIRSNDVLMGIVMPIKTMVNILFFLLLTSNMKIAQKSFDTGLKASISMFVGITSALVASIFGNSELG